MLDKKIKMRTIGKHAPKSQRKCLLPDVLTLTLKNTDTRNKNFKRNTLKTSNFSPKIVHLPYIF